MSKKSLFNKYALTGVLLAMSVGTWAQEPAENPLDHQEDYSLQVNYIEVNEWNRHDVLGTLDSLGYATVIFDGDSTLILHNAEIIKVSWGVTNGKGLRVHLIESNYNANYDYGGGDLFEGPQKADILPTLTFTTDANRPGALWLDMNESICDLNFDEIFYKDGLDYVIDYEDGEDATYSISATVKPLLSEGVSEDGQPVPAPTEVTFTDDDFIDDMGDEVDLSNTVVNGVLYTMSDSETDGYDNGGIVFGTSMTEAEVEEAMQYEPGSYEFAYAFTGATFKVPAGTGLIKLTVQIDEGGIMMVKIGKNSPVAITAMDGEVEIPYVCAEPAFVYVYNGTEVSTARMSDKFREKKVTIVVRMSGISVTPDVLQQMSSPGADARAVFVLSPGGFVLKDYVVRVEDENVTGLADGLFSGVKARYFDLSKTSISGVEVSRSRGAFEGVDDDAFIYVPVGNTAAEGEPNVVIGSVCENMQLSGDNKDTAFEAGMDFSANVKFDRDFTAGQTSTVYWPFAVSKDDADAVGSFYTFKGIDSNGDAELELVQTDLEANTPYIFKKAADGKPAQFANVKVKQLPTMPVTTASLIGTYEYKEFTSEDVKDYLYGYAANADTEAGIAAGEFVRIAAGAFIKPFRAYLKLEGDAGARINIKWGEEGDANGISEAALLYDKGQMINDNCVYDLQGRRLDSVGAGTVPALRKGIYIHGGRKVVIR